ncbi:glycosyl transferase family 2 [Pseudonocardia hierapolitana]|uniref:Glycosyl transferase family 2 n=1 Tax=Pseudonocardia hierapolitana TaxID=1128676 RepID=A0A561SVV0_9PSEU|nr:glycosyltransferase [Pseudonocardia hierapolitana]TWF78975.1 glycosyl transferase family 2 [Pseudonocardia hierapolitana]
MPADDAAAQPALTILSAVDGPAPHLAEMIDSVVAQTVDDWELVVVANGTSDDVERIVAEYAEDPRIRMLRQPYQGVAGGVNAAAAVARGAYYAVLPGDGRLEPTFCGRVAEVLAEHPEIDVLCIDALPFLEGTDQWPSFRQRCGITDEPGVGHRVGLAEIVRRPALYTTAAIRASVWKAAGGYPADTPQVESLAMCLRMSVAGCDLRVLPEQLGGYRLHADNLEHRPRDHGEYDASVERAFLRVAAITDDPQVLAELRSTLRRHRYETALRLARAAVRESDPRTAREHAWLALRQRPSVRPAVMWALLRVAPGGIDTVKAAKRRITGLVHSGVQRG